MNSPSNHSDSTGERVLAIHGGTPAFPDGPPTWPLPNASVKESLIAAYEDGSWGRYLGEAQQQVARLVADLVQQEHIRLCSSGTIAVELALHGAGVTTGDEVILAGYDFPGNFRCIESCGATPVLVDIERSTLAIDPTQLPAAASAKTKAVIVSHLHGGLAKMSAICEWARENQVAVIEDACQSPGATVEGQSAGSWGDIAVLSFGGSKLMTAGRGGAVGTRHLEMHQRMKIFADRGNDAFPLSELQSAVLPCQFQSLATQNATRCGSATILSESLVKATGLDAIDCGDGINHRPGYYKYSMLLDDEHFTPNERVAWTSAVRAEGVACDAGFRGFVKRGSRRCRKIGDLANSKAFSELGVILHHPILLASESDIRKVVEVLEQVTRKLKSS